MTIKHEVFRTLPLDLALAGNNMFIALTLQLEGHIDKAQEYIGSARSCLQSFLDDPQPINYSIRHLAFSEWGNQNFGNKPWDEIWDTLYKVCLYSKDHVRVGEYISRLRHMLLTLNHTLNDQHPVR